MRFFFLTLVSVLFLSSSGLGWGFNVHRMIAESAVESLRGKPRDYFGRFEAEIVRYSTYPDENRKEEPGAHSIEMDFYGDYPFDEVPSDYGAAVEKYGTDTVIAHGWAPWAAEKYFRLLVEAMKNGSPEVPKYAGVMIHYISDLHMPLHTSVNSEGAYPGFHLLWESAVVDILFSEEMLPESEVPSESVTDPADFFAGVPETWKDNEPLSRAAKESRNPLVLWQKTKGIAARNIGLSARLSASLLAKAYFEAFGKEPVD